MVVDLDIFARKLAILLSVYLDIAHACWLAAGVLMLDYLDSTELLLPSATSWTTTAALPSARDKLRGATLDNKVIMIGTNICRYSADYS